MSANDYDERLSILPEHVEQLERGGCWVVTRLVMIMGRAITYKLCLTNNRQWSEVRQTSGGGLVYLPEQLFRTKGEADAALKAAKESEQPAKASNNLVTTP